MARRWTFKEEHEKRKELLRLYVRQNKTIGEISRILGVTESTVYDRLLRLDILVTPERKTRYLHKRHDIIIPSDLSRKLAEFIGIMLGDGHLAQTQISISVAKREMRYGEYVASLIKKIFGASPKCTAQARKGAYDLYLGSVDVVRFLEKMGLVNNKVKAQVDIPNWIRKKPEYQASFLRGFFDTDGSVYRLRHGVQFSFCNRSLPLLSSVRSILQSLHYHPSHISGYNLYLTRKQELRRYKKEIGFGNPKHLERSIEFGII